MIAITAVVAFAAYIFYKASDAAKADDSGSDSEDEGAENTQFPLEPPLEGLLTPQAAGEGAEKAASEDPKALFDNALSLADKLAKGQRYVQAAAKYTDAITILQSGAAKFDAKTSTTHLLALHNNRSAMHEKAGAEHFPQALQDIQLVLSLDNKHKKARARRARILEASGRLQEALVDYTIHFMLEQLDQSSTQPPSSGEKVDELGRLLGMRSAAQALPQSAEGTALPSKAVCRKCFEQFPCTAVWSERFRNTSATEQIQLYDSASPDNNLAELMDVVTCAIAQGAFSTAFKYLNKPAHVQPARQPHMQPLLALQKRLLGMRRQLGRDTPGAVVCYKESLALEPGNLESTLMLACR